MQAIAPTLPISRSRPAAIRSSAIAIVTVAGALLLSKLAQSLSISTPFHFFYGAVALSAWYSGINGGIVAILLSVLTSNYFLIEPINAFSFSFDAIFRITTFLVISTLLTALSEARLRDRDAALRARERAAYLASISQTLARSLDYPTTLQQAAELAVPALADWCVIDLIGDTGQIEMVAAAHRDPAKVRWAYDLREKYPIDQEGAVGAPQVIRSGASELYAEISDSLLASVARNPEELSILRAVGYRSVMIVPLRVGGRVIGAISFVIAESDRRYGDEDVALAQEAAGRVAVAIENARLYTQAHEARAQAEHAVRARDDFLSVAAHELKTPLTSLQLQVQLMERRAARSEVSDGRTQRGMQVISSQVRRLDRLIGALLDISRLEHGQLTVRRDRLDLDALARRTIDEIQPVSEAHPISYTLVGPAPAVIGDELRLEQVLQNLLHNAIKYSPDGGQIAVRLESGDGQARIAVTDSGIGIPPEALPNLFTQFYRAANASPEHIGGMGIGLYVVREIVRLHGGSAAVTSVEGQGCTFTVELPCQSFREG